MLPAKEDHSVQAFVLDRFDENLGICIQVRASWRQLDDLHSRSFQYLGKVLGEQRVAVMDQVSLSLQEAIEPVCQMPCNLIHPLAIRSGCHTGNLDFPGL